MKRAQAVAPITSLQPPYSMLVRGVEEEILPYCAEQKIGVIVYAPMRSGLLTGAMTRARAAALPASDWRHNSPDFQEPKLSRNLQLVDLLAAIGKRYGRTPGRGCNRLDLASSRRYRGHRRRAKPEAGTGSARRGGIGAECGRYRGD